MEGWTDGDTHRQSGTRMDGRMDTQIYGLTGRCRDRHMEGQIDRQIEEHYDGHMDDNTISK